MKGIKNKLIWLGSFLTVPLLFAICICFFIFHDFSTDDHIVAVIDSGVDKNHPLLKGKVMNGFNFLNFNHDTSDTNGHGTHISGVIVSESPKSKILPIKILGESGAGKTTTFMPIAYAIIRGADVINMSYSQEYDSKIAQWMVNIAHKKGIILVAATGNDGSHQVAYPAKYDHVLGIGMSNQNNGISSIGNVGKGLDYLAPGVDIKSAGLKHTYTRKTGTSISSAYASGLIGYLQTARPENKDIPIETLLKESSNVVSKSNPLLILDKNKWVAKHENKVYTWIHKPKRYSKTNKVSMNVYAMNADKVTLLYDRTHVVFSKKGNVNKSVDVTLPVGSHKFVLIAEKNHFYYNKYFDVTVDQSFPKINVDYITTSNGIMLKAVVTDESLKKITVIDHTKEKTSYDFPDTKEKHELYIPLSSLTFPIQIIALDGANQELDQTIE